MKIILPMAGFGKRLRPHTWSKPKPLVSVAGKPVLGHIIDMFEGLEQIDELVFIVGYLGGQIREFVGKTYPFFKACYVVQDELIGQSHAIWLAREHLEGPVLMIFVDTIIETDLSTLASEKADGVIWVKQVPDPRRFGVADVGPDGWVRRLIEKPKDIKNNLAIVGVYYFKEAQHLLAAIEEQLRKDIQLKGEYYLADAIQILIDQGHKIRVQPVDVWKDCGKPDALLETNRYLLENGHDNSEQALKRSGVVVIPPVYIDPSAQVAHSIIGPHVSIAGQSVIEGSIIKNSIIEPGAKIQGVVLSDSLIGQEACIEGQAHSLNVGDSSEVTLPRN